MTGDNLQKQCPSGQTNVLQCSQTGADSEKNCFPHVQQRLGLTVVIIARSRSRYFRTWFQVSPDPDILSDSKSPPFFRGTSNFCSAKVSQLRNFWTNLTASYSSFFCKSSSCDRSVMNLPLVPDHPFGPISSLTRRRRCFAS